MNRPPVCSVLLLLAVLLIGCDLQAKRDSPVPEAAVLEATVAPAEPSTPVQVGDAPLPAQSAATSTPLAEPSPTADLAALPLDSPLIPSSQQTVLLPTVTPTPNRAVTPTPLPPVAAFLPIGEPERHPLATPYYSATEELAQRGITYTERTGAGFGLFPFNDISPCLCRSLYNAHECSREIEAYLLNAPVDGIVRTDGCLSIELGDGQIATFDDIDDDVGSVMYSYREKLPDINFHLLQITGWEWGGYLLVDGASGAATGLPAYPAFSPDNRHFALAFLPSGDFAYTLFVQVWDFADRVPRFEQGWRIEKLSTDFEYPLPVLTWASTERFYIRWPTAQGQLADADMRVELETHPDGSSWAIYYNDQPIKQPVVEADTIRFANGGIDTHEFLDALREGKPVYIDRVYIYTSVPAELDGATYFRLPQYYFLGEDEDYFPLEMQLANYLQFQVNDDARVYVALDAQVRVLPDWMQTGWQAVDLNLETNDIPLQLYRKTYPAGALVELVDRWMQDNRVPSQFIVIVTPDVESTLPSP